MRLTIAVILISCTALAACGGGESGGAGGGVTIPPTGSPTPTPTPNTKPGVLATGEVKPAVDATFISATLEVTTIGGSSQTNGIITGGSTQDRITIFDTPQFQGRYSPSAGYTLSDSVNSVTFAPANLAQDTTTPSGFGSVLFTKINGSNADYLALYQASAYSSSSSGSGYATAMFGGIAGWQHSTNISGGRRTRLDYFAFGSVTPIGAMPRSGTVRFKMVGAGNYATDTDLFFLRTGSSDSITVDFGAGTVIGSVTVAGQNFYKDQVGSKGYVPISGQFTGNSMVGSIAGAVLDTGLPKGKFRLMFVGPNADEIVLTYVVQDDDEAVVAAFVGLRDLYP